MKLVVAKKAGFCMGVRRAVEVALDAPNKFSEPIFTYGPLIHNPQVLELLAAKGISVLGEIPPKGEGTILIRAHGVPPEAKERLKKAGFRVVDTTCPRVIRVQTIIRKHAEKGYNAIILGDRNHPEVIGLIGFAGDRGHVVESMGALQDLPVFSNAILVAQTTQNIRFFKEATEWIRTQRGHYKIFNTICGSTENRQTEVQELASAVDAVVVVGGKSSGNTKRLAEIAGKEGTPTFHVESETELDSAVLSGMSTIGISAGASTPNWVTKRILKRLEFLPSRRDSRIKRTLLQLQRILLLTNIYVAMAAGFLCLAFTRLLEIGNGLPYVLVTTLYVLSMHMLNHLMGTSSDRYNDPERADFYRNNKKMLSVLAIVAGGSGLITAFLIGLVPFFVLLLMSVTGLSYNRTIIPGGFTGGRYRRIRDLPGSKTILIALAWGAATTLVPRLGEMGGIDSKAAFSFILSFGLVFTRTAFFDVLDMQGDRIVGKETIPILMGSHFVLRMLKILLAVAGTVMFLTGLTGYFPAAVFFMMVCPVYLFILLIRYQKEAMLPGIGLEFQVETSFVITGLAAILGTAF